jgi:hypothetical protein
MYSIDVNLFPDFFISWEFPWFLDLQLYAAQEAQSQCVRSVFSRFLASYFVVLSSGTFSVPFIWIFSLFSTLFYPFVLWLNSNCTFFLWYFVSCVAIGVEIELALGVWCPRWPPNTNRGGRGPRRCGVHMSGRTKKQGRSDPYFNIILALMPVCCNREKTLLTLLSFASQTSPSSDQHHLPRLQYFRPFNLAVVRLTLCSSSAAP